MLMAEYPLPYPLSISKGHLRRLGQQRAVLVAEGPDRRRAGRGPGGRGPSSKEAVAEAACADLWMRDHAPVVTMDRRAVRQQALPPGRPGPPSTWSRPPTDVTQGPPPRSARHSATTCGCTPTPACRRSLQPRRRPARARSPDESVPVSELVAVTEDPGARPGPRLPLTGCRRAHRARQRCESAHRARSPQGGGGVGKRRADSALLRGQDAPSRPRRYDVTGSA